MNINTLNQKPKVPKPLPWIRRADEYIEQRLQEWRNFWAKEPAALAYCKREGWILENEFIESVTALNLFPFATITELKSLLREIESGAITEAQASKAVKVAVQNGFHEAECGINGIRYGLGSIMSRPPRPVADVLAKVAPPISQPVGAAGEAVGGTDALTAAPLTGYAVAAAMLGGRKDPTPPPKAAETAAQSLRGKPEALCDTSRRIHTVTLGGVEAYATEPGIADDLQSAQVSGLTVEAVVERGDFGNRILSIKVTNPTT